MTKSLLRQCVRYMRKLRKTHFRTWLALAIVYCIIMSPLLCGICLLAGVSFVCRKIGDFGEWLNWRIL